jgi:ethanolaminephosphotransferase
MGYLFASMIAAFYVTLWEEYHLHRFQLPVVNGPNEGLLMSIIIALIAAFKGREWFEIPVADDDVATFICYACIASALLTVSSHVWRTLTTLKSDPGKGQQAVNRAIVRLAPLAVFVVYICVMTSDPRPTNFPYTLFWAVGINFARFDANFMLRMVCQEDIELFPSYLWPMPVIVMIFMTEYYVMLEDILNLLYFVWSLYSFGSFVRKLVTELCHVLSIHPFKIHVLP